VGLDSNGRIVTANTTALRFWQTTIEAFCNTPFAKLFVFDGTSVASAGMEAQWTLLLTNALDRSVTSLTRLPGGTTAEVGLRIEESQGGAAGFFAIIENPALHRDSTPPLLVDSGLALLADESSVGFFDLNFKARQIYYSPAWKHQLGYADHEISNSYDSWLRLIHPDDSAAAPDHAPRKQKPGVRSYSVEIRMLHHDGHYAWVQCMGTLVVGADGELERVTGLQFDINERKELDEQSLLSDERLQKLTGADGIATFDFDFAHGKFWLSQGWRKLIEAYDPAVSELDSFLSALPQDVAARGAENFFLAPAPGRESFLQAQILHNPQGQPVPVVIGANRQLTRRGGLARAIGFCCPLPQDLNSTLSAVSNLPLPPTLISGTLACLVEAVIVADSLGRIIYLNPQAERLTALPMEKARGTLLGDVFKLSGRVTGLADEEALVHAFNNSDQSPLCADHSLLAADGKNRPIVWNASQIHGNGRQVEGVVVVFRNPDEMSLSPEELIKINRWESLGVVAGGIAHDFNNLLTTILGGISHAKDNNDKSYLSDSERACLAAKSLTKQLLAAAKGGGSTSSQALSPIELLEEAVRLARAGSNAEIALNAADTVAPIRVNRAQMMQVFQNLIINALQALPAQGGKITIGADNTRISEGAMPPLPAGSYVAIEVKDNGSGIPYENLAKIFEPFFTTKQQGTGLGLSTVRNLVRKHGGQITVSSVVGEGTVFRILLPQANQPAETETRRSPILRTGTGRVLLMDDDPDISRLAAGMLASLDYKYDVARNGEEAIALYRRYVNVGRPYDLVILDLTVIGGMGGEEAFRQLREIDKDVRAIVCSGYDSEEMARQYMDMGFVGYLAKPFRLGDLARAIKAVLG
jgi:PAS domain S-box-containing protein